MMYCPICRTEYRENLKRCSDCDAELVPDLPAETAPEYENLVSVFEGDAGSAAVARATVADAGIESWVKDEDVHGIFPNLGSTEILVCEEDRKRALEALETLEQGTPTAHSEGLSTPMPFPSAPGERHENRAQELRSTRGRQKERSEKGHPLKEHHHQGKRI